MTPGIHLSHKPIGPTSFSVVQQCIASAEAARPAGSRARVRMCHGGVLDPFASGLLLILVGGATRLFDYLHAVPKAYEATVRWGVETDNGDPGGKATFEGDASILSVDRLDEALPTFVGWHDQVPPATSNKRVDGERAYLRAHRGEAVALPPTRVYLHEASWLSHDLPHESRLRLVARGGYYVRALARDLGRQLGCGAHLSALRRVAIGPWEDPGEGRVATVSGRGLLPWAPSRELSDQEVGDLRHGKTIAPSAVTPGEWALPPGFPDPVAPVRGFHRGRLAFLLSATGGALKALTEFRGGL